MNSRIPDTHAEAWALLPWLANGRIAPEDREWVEAHVQGCAECRAETASQRRVASQVVRDEEGSPSPASSDEQKSFNKLWARIELAESASIPVTGTHGAPMPVPRSSRTVRWLAAAVVVQAIGLGVLGLAVRTPAARPAANFETVTRTQPDARPNVPAVSIAFAPQTSIGTINTLLTHQGLSIVSGPGDSGNYRAELSADAVASGASADSVAAVMAKDPNVTFAQPIAK